MSDQATEKKGLWGRLKSGLGKTRNQLASGVGNLLLGEKEIDEHALEELETALLLTDVGLDTTADIMDQLTARVRRKELNDTRALYDALADLLKGVLAALCPSARDPRRDQTVRHLLRGRERGREDNDHRQAGEAVETGRPFGSACRRRHLSCRRRGAAQELGRTGRHSCDRPGSGFG